MGVLLGTGWLVLAVASQKDELRAAQVAVVRTQASVTAPAQSPQGLLHGQPATPYEFVLNRGLRSDLASSADGLLAASHTPQSRSIATTTDRYLAAITRMMDLIRRDRLPDAQKLNDGVVQPLSNQLAAQLKKAETQLGREIAAAGRMVWRGTLAVVLAAAFFLIVVMFTSNAARRRRVRAETKQEMAQHSEQRMQVLLRNSSDMITVVAPDTTVLYQAGSVVSVLGHEPSQLEGAALTDWVDEADAATLRALCAAPHSSGEEIRMRHADGTVRTCEVRATELPADAIWSGVVLNIRDVGERKTLEMELQLAQRLEAVGQLSAGIAHEINTPVQFLSDTTSFVQGAVLDLVALVRVETELREATERGTVSSELLERVSAATADADLTYLNERLPAAFERMNDGLARIANIVAAMRSFAVPPSTERAPVDINEAVRNTLVVTANEYRHVAELTTELGTIPTLRGNAGEINQVLLSLILNASHAIADTRGESKGQGRLHVRTSCEDDDVLISISDSGGGIPKEIADRIFDQFFTTKEVGTGTGQGLAIARTLVVDRHGGTLSFESQQGEGTTFFVRLPLNPQGADVTNTALAA
ncbi:MAG: two-component system, NtrC family, sensor kinase [Solirubrobacteraceae bacterium]|nr:two-component system, NtrC family, sensor kinase [Solirubrobacteraceae bacterium]